MELNNNDITAAAYLIQRIALGEKLVTLDARDCQLLLILLQNSKFKDAAWDRWESIFVPEPVE